MAENKKAESKKKVEYPGDDPNWKPMKVQGKPITQRQYFDLVNGNISEEDLIKKLQGEK